jgi:hypothetical protein
MLSGTISYGGRGSSKSPGSKANFSEKARQHEVDTDLWVEVDLLRYDLSMNDYARRYRVGLSDHQCISVIIVIARADTILFHGRKIGKWH